MLEPKRSLPPNKPHRTPAWLVAVGLGFFSIFLIAGVIVGFLASQMHRDRAAGRYAPSSSSR